MSYTLSDMIIEVYENLGESSDLYPYGVTYGTVDLTTQGAQKLQKWINRAYRKVTSSQLADGTFVRFRSLERHAYFTQSVLNLTVSNVIDSTHIQITGLFSVVNKYQNWIIDLGASSASASGTEQHLVIANDASSPPILTLANPITTTPTGGSAVNVYKKFFACSLNSSSIFYHPNEFIPIDPKEDFLSALWIYDIQSMRDIKRYEEKAPLRKNVLTQIYPGMFWDLETPGGMWSAQATAGGLGLSSIGGGIEFDVPPTNGLTFELHYYASGEQLTVLTHSPLIPEPFSEPICKWATKIGMLRDREWDGAYALRKEFESDLQTLIQDGALRFEYDLPYLWIDT